MTLFKISYIFISFLFFGYSNTISLQLIYFELDALPQIYIKSYLNASRFFFFFFFFFFFSSAGDYTGRPIEVMNENCPPQITYGPVRTVCSALLLPLAGSPPSAADGSGSSAGHLVLTTPHRHKGTG